MTALTTCATSAASAWRSLKPPRKSRTANQPSSSAKKSTPCSRTTTNNDGHIAVWPPAPPGLQQLLIHSAPATYFKPPYVGVRGWIGVELSAIGDDELAEHIREAWRLIAPKTLK
jgi:hypothetical protein